MVRLWLLEWAQVSALWLASQSVPMLALVLVPESELASVQPLALAC